MSTIDINESLERQKLAKENKKYMLLSTMSIIVFLVIWELITDVFKIFPTYSLPSPYMVTKAFIIKLYSTSPDGSILIVHIMASLQVVLLGYLLAAIIGIPLGILMAWYKPVDMWIKPVFDLIRPIPPIGWVPIMVIIFGIGIGSKVMVVFISAFIPMVLNSYSGIKQTKEVHINVAKTFGAKKREILWKVAIPTAMPMVFTGLRVALGVAWMTLVAAELVAATKGVGYMLQIARTIGKSDIIVMGMFVLAGVGSILIAVLDFLERKFVRR
jgi:NitT/TauT family transport system permease protein/taurine transport system permease protein